MGVFRFIIVIDRKTFSLQLPHVVILYLVLEFVDTFDVQVRVYVSCVKDRLELRDHAKAFLTLMILHFDMLALSFFMSLAWIFIGLLCYCVPLL